MVATILLVFLKMNWPNLGQFNNEGIWGSSWQIDIEIQTCLQAYKTGNCIIIIGGPIDEWAPVAKYWGPGPLSPRNDAPGTVHRMSQRSTDALDRIQYTILCHNLPITVGSLRVSLSVTDNGGDPVWSSSFCGLSPLRSVTKFWQNFLPRHLTENGMLKILAAYHSGPLSSRGPTNVRTVLNG